MGIHLRGGRRTVAVATLFVSALFGVTGCGTAPAPAPQPSAAQPAAAAGAPAEKTAPPATVRIPKIGAESSLVQIGLKADGTLDVPPVDKPMQAAWYRESPVPGNRGPALIVGHVDGRQQPGIFFRLREVAAGDQVVVGNGDGSQTTFTVTRTQQIDKDQLPSDAVYGDTPGPELRLITCGGSFDKAEHSYRDNIIVYAKAA
ncbi:class F sortase [Amycolatopsis samaneae]|uniref:Class F sortase n=1 Tax=Amycolatopsis samaneae TaxID=664691 RepID=A0ABW5G786_9PSEU